MMQRVVRFLQKEPTIWGPISLLFTVSLAVKTAIPFDLLFVAAAGLFLSARLQIRGCCYSLILLALAGIVKHSFFISDHLWYLGVEGSIACAFFITALAFEQGAAWIDSLQSQMETRKAALENVEEELSKVQQSAQEQQIIFQEKVSTLQRELEEVQTEHSSLLILNEVLRKTTARHIKETETISGAFLNLERQIVLLRGENEFAEKELARIKNSEALVIQNSELMKELNQARYDKEQTHLINETLARLHYKEVLKAKDADREAASLQEQLSAAHKEVRRIAEPLETELAAARQRVQTLEAEFEKSSLEANRAREHLLKLGEIQTERNFLKERLQAALEEIALLQQKPVVREPEVIVKTDPQLVEQLKFAQEKMVHLSQIEPLFKQLKKQFDEKNQILHETRSVYFKADTELQKLKMEKAALELNPLPKEVQNELESLSEQVSALEEENQELQELISILTDTPSDAAKRKKKLKTQRTSPEQEFLF
jgi:hypothetical protein